MGAVTVADLDALIAEIATKEKEISLVEADLKERNKAVSTLQAQAVGYLKELGRDGYSAPQGKITIVEHWQVRTPQTPEAKEKLFAWMRERGIFDAYATVNALSLKALFKKERELAIEEGQDPTLFALPGMEPGSVYEGLKFVPTKEQSNV